MNGAVGALTLSSVLLFALGCLIIRVAWRGEHLGRFRLVSYVKIHEGEPLRAHRAVTAIIGALAVVAGLVFAALALYLYGVRRGVFHLPS